MPDPGSSPQPDPRVAAALEHWAPRFAAQGVDPGDLTRIAAAIRDWDGWCGAWHAVAAEHEALGRAALDGGRTRSGGEHLARAAVCYHFGKFLPGPDRAALRTAHQAAVRCLTDALPHLDPPGERVMIPFDGTELAGVLRRPASAAATAGAGGIAGAAGPGPCPLVILIAGLDSAKEEFRAVEDAFLRRGLATLAVDGPGQGEAEEELAIRPDWEVPGAAIIDAAATLPGIDPGRIGVWGVSLGGYYAPRLASGDRRVRACAALSGPFSFGDAWDQLPELSRHAFTVRSKSADQAEARQRADELTLAGRGRLLTAPLLVIAGRRDRIIPWQHALRLSRAAAGPTELLILPEGNHGCTNLTYRHRPYTADWLSDQLRR